MDWKKLALEQAELIKQLQARIAELEAKIAALEKNSSNSSKPPSSDIVKPPKPTPNDSNGKKMKRKIGAQPGHEQNLRKPLHPELVDEIFKLQLTNCPDCGHSLDLAKTEAKTFQQIELVEKPFIVTEYQQLMYWCKNWYPFTVLSRTVKQKPERSRYSGVLTDVLLRSQSPSIRFAPFRLLYEVSRPGP